MADDDTPEMTPVGLSKEARKIIEGRQRPSPLDQFKKKPEEPQEKPTKGRKGGMFRFGPNS